MAPAKDRPKVKAWRNVDHPRKVGRRIAEARLALGKSQREVAFPGCSYAYLSRLEAGTRTASGHLLEELARRLGVSRRWLETGRDILEVEISADALPFIVLWVSECLNDLEDDGDIGIDPATLALLPATLPLLDEHDRTLAHDLLDRLAQIGERMSLPPQVH